MERLDNHLNISLPYGYRTSIEYGEEGDRYLQVACNPVTGADGRETADLVVHISSREGSFDAERANLVSRFKALAVGKIGEFGIQVGIGGNLGTARTTKNYGIGLYILIILIEHHDVCYLLRANKYEKREKEEEAIACMAEYLNVVLNGIEIDGDRGDFAPLTASFLSELLQAGGENRTVMQSGAEDAQTPKAEACREDPSEKRRIEEEARKQRIAEQQQKASARGAYRNQLDTWKKKRDEARAKRGQEFQKRMEAERQKTVAQADQAFETVRKAQQSLIDAAQATKQERQKALSALGLFKFSEKKAVRGQITAEDRKIEEAKAKIREAETKRAEQLRIDDEQQRKMELAVRKALLTEFPAPLKPEDEDERESTATVRANRRMADAILEALYDGGAYTVDEIMEMVPQAADASSQRVSSVLKQLRDDGTIAREEIRHRAYFRIS